MKNPVERLADKLIAGDSQKAALLVSGNNRRYFTQFPSSAGALLITAEEAYLLMDFRYEEAAGYKAKNCQVVGFTSLPEKVGGAAPGTRRQTGVHGVRGALCGPGPQL